MIKGKVVAGIRKGGSSKAVQCKWLGALVDGSRATRAVAAAQVNVETHAKDIAEQNAERKNHIQPPESCSAGPKLLACTREVND